MKIKYDWDKIQLVGVLWKQAEKELAVYYAELKIKIEKKYNINK